MLKILLMPKKLAWAWTLTDGDQKKNADHWNYSAVEIS